MAGPKTVTKRDDLLSLLGNRFASPIINPMVQTCKLLSRSCFGKSPLSECPFLDNPSIALIILASGGLDPCDLARLEGTSKFFKNPAGFSPDRSLSIAEVAAHDMCNNRTFFKSMNTEEKIILKQNCGGSWKLVLKFLLAGERACPRREKSHVSAGCGHSVVVSSQGFVYSFGRNNFGQLGHGTLTNEPRPRRISSLEGTRVVQTVSTYGKTMLVSDCGDVYTFGTLSFGDHTNGTNMADKLANVPQFIEPLKNIFVVQIAIGQYFIAALSREGKVYTLYWGKKNKLGHQTDLDDLEAHLLDGALENIPVVQISAGHCYLLALAFQPSGLSVYSVGCGQGGKLGHGTTDNEPKVRLIEQLQTLNIDPIKVAAGSWHIVLLSKDGRVCTWGWGNGGCLGHGNEDHVKLPKVIEGLSQVKAIDVAAGVMTTFVVSDNGDVYSFGSDYSSSLGHVHDVLDGEIRKTNVLTPKIVASFKQITDRVIQISATKSALFEDHTLVLTESGKLYAHGLGKYGQLGIKLQENEKKSRVPELVDINLG